MLGLSTRFFLAAAIFAEAQTPQPVGVTLVYHYERAGLPVPVYSFTVHEDGSAIYTATYLPVPVNGRFGENPANVSAAPSTDATTPITLSPATTARLFERVRSTNHFRGGCQSKAKNIANSGNRTLDLSGAEGHDTCAYSYTENKAIEAVTVVFDGISETQTMGRQLDFDHRFDRLGLDQHMIKLVEAVQDGRALEVQTIAPILRSIAEDAQVIERVRLRAAKLLEMGPAVH